MPFAPQPSPGEEYFRFVAIFTWTHQEDELAAKRFLPYIQSFEGTGIHQETAVCLYLTGERTVIFSGYSNSATGLQRLCSGIIFNTPIQGRFYHAVDAVEIMKALPQSR